MLRDWIHPGWGDAYARVRSFCGHPIEDWLAREIRLADEAEQDEALEQLRWLGCPSEYDYLAKLTVEQLRSLASSTKDEKLCQALMYVIYERLPDDPKNELSRRNYQADRRAPYSGRLANGTIRGAGQAPRSIPAPEWLRQKIEAEGRAKEVAAKVERALRLAQDHARMTRQLEVEAKRAAAKREASRRMKGWYES